MRLDNVLIDGTKLHVNLPRFSRRGFSGEHEKGYQGLKVRKKEVLFSHKYDGEKLNQ